MKAPSTKKMAVYRALRDLALSLPPGAPLGDTIFGFARKFGVSPKTVQAAVKLLKSEGIITARTKVGLRVHPSRPQPRRREERLLFLASGAARNKRFPSCIRRGIREAAERHDFTVIEKDPGGIREALALAREGLISCAAVSLYRPGKALVRAAVELASSGVHVCAVDQVIKGLDSVVIDNRSVGRMAARYMFSQRGIRRAFIMRRYYYAQAEAEREEGIIEILDELAVAHSRLRWATCISGHECQVFPEFLAAGFDVVFAHTAEMAAEIRRIASEVTGKAPLAVSVGTEEELKEHQVSGIVVSPEEMGEKAVQLLVERRRDPFRPPQILRIEGRIFIP